VLVDGSVNGAPDTVDLDVRLIDVPSVARRMPGEPCDVGQQRGESLYPPISRDVINLHASFDQQFLNVAVRQVVAQVPAHRDHDHLGREPEPGERRLRR